MMISELRFADGNVTSEGVIEVRLIDEGQSYPGRYTKWMKVCYEYEWSEYDAAAICGQLGFQRRRITDFVPLVYEQTAAEGDKCVKLELNCRSGDSDISGCWGLSSTGLEAAASGMLRGVRCAHDAKQLSPRAETTASLIRDWYRRHMPHDGAADDNWFELPTLGLRFWFALWPLLVQSMLAVSGLMYLLLTSKVVKGASEAWSLRSAARAFACVVLLPAIVIITPFSSLVFDLFVVEILVIPFENLSNEGYFIFKDIGKDSKEQATRLGAFHQVILVARRAMLAFFAFFGSEWLRMETPTLPFSSLEWRLMLGGLCVADFFCSIRVLNLMSLRPTEKPFRGGLSYFDIFTAMQAISKLDHQQFCHQRVLPKGGTNKGTARTAVQTLVQTLYNCLFAKKKKTEKGGEEKQEKQEKQKLVLSSPGLPGRAEKREDAVKELGIPEYSEAFDMLEAVEDHAMHDREGFIVKQSENSEEKSKTTREQLLTVTLGLLNNLKEISKQGEGGKKKLKSIVKKIEEYEPWGSGEPGATLARELGELNKEDEVTKLDGGSNGTLTIQTAAGQTVELGPNTKNEVTQKVTQNTTIRRIQEILAENHMKNLPKKEKKKTCSGKQWTEADSVVILNPKRCPKRPSDASKQGEQSADESTPLADPKCSRKVTLPNYLTPDEYEEEDINMSKNNGSYTLADFGILDDEMGDHVLHAWYDHPMRALPLKNGLDFELWGNSDLNEGDAKDADEKERKRKKQAKEEMQKGHWERGETVKKCTYFVSHAWNDEKLFPKKKVRMLRGFLCLQQLLVRWTIAFPLMALFFVPLGFAIDAIIRDAVRNMVEYDLAHGGDGSGVAIAGLIDIFLYVPWASVMIIYFLLLIWLVAASNDSLPDSGDRRIFGRRWRIPPPWALYSSTLWLDKTCVRQNTTETVASGTKSFARFLPQCDQMIAFLGPSYFSRLWCVYELATFCRDKLDNLPKGDDVMNHLTLLNLEWPSPLDPNKDPDLTAAERKTITEFSCLNVKCTKPSDRHVVLAAIRMNWCKDGPAEKAHENFDNFVKNELMEVLAKSKKNYATYAVTEFSRQFALFFGS